MSNDATGRPLHLIDSWKGPRAAGWAIATAEESAGSVDRIFRWASVSKVVTAMAVWLAVEEGTVSWDDPVGPPGATLAHLLAHASGLAPDGEQVLAPAGTRRIYSNRGFELAAELLAERAGMPFAEYVRDGVLDPLGLSETQLLGSPAWGISGPLTDLLALGKELMWPSIFSSTTIDLASTVAFPGLSGVLPGFGQQKPNDWGLGVEIRDGKRPHWTGTLNSPRTYGHFGQSGAFLWVDPQRATVACALADRPFGPWAIEAWPALSDAVIQASASASAAAAGPPHRASPG